MKNRLVIYFHYDPRGQVDETCRIAVAAMQKESQAFVFVTNGALQADAQKWVKTIGALCRERENTGFDVGAYKEILCSLGPEGVLQYDEIILMNYTLAGPVCDLRPMLEEMDSRPELDFWGLTRHYAMRSKRFKTEYGIVPEHIQSHFIAIRPRLFNAVDFWQYWQKMPLPQSYEQSVALHEARFTKYFCDKGYRWDTYVDTTDLQPYFVNPIMSCPEVLLRQKGCPFFKRRSFFTPYADELRRTDGCAAGELYHYLKAETQYPIDTLLRELLQTQSLAELTKNLHLHYMLPNEKIPVRILEPQQILKGTALDKDCFYLLNMPGFFLGTAGWYERKSREPFEAEKAAVLLQKNPLLGLAGPVLPLFRECRLQKEQYWEEDFSKVKNKMAERKIAVPVDARRPLPLPNGGFVVVKGSAFPKGLPALQCRADWWLLPLIAQQNGFYSATCETSEQVCARADITDEYTGGNTVRSAALELARTIKRKIKRKADREI